jgi:hypothetical protein
MVAGHSVIEAEDVNRSIFNATRTRRSKPRSTPNVEPLAEMGRSTRSNVTRFIRQKAWQSSAWPSSCYVRVEETLCKLSF